MGKLEKKRFIGKQFFIESRNRNKSENNIKISDEQIFLDMTEENLYRTFNESINRISQMEIPNINYKGPKIDISVIIPIKNRVDQLPTSIFFINKEIERSDLRIKIVVVEQDIIPNNRETCIKYGVDYIFIKSSDSFNKCLCHNIGSLFYESDYLIFHDVDLIVPEYFFDNLIKNLKNKRAIQCFSGRRVFYLDSILSQMIRNEKNINLISGNMNRIREGKEGAPGGSIIIEKEFFESIGGFDHNLFWGYSIEDGFFWKKIQLREDITGSNDPKIDMYHLWHEPTHNTNPNLMYDHRIYDLFLKFNGNQIDNYLKKCTDEYNKLKKYVDK